MGWHVGLSYEEMQQQFGEEQQQQQQQPDNVETTETKTDNHDDDNDCGGTTSSTTNDTDGGVGVDEEAVVDPTTTITTAISATTISATISANNTANTVVGCPLPFNDNDSSLLVLQPPPKEYTSIYHLCRYNDWNDCLDTSVSTGSTDNNNSTDSTGTEEEHEQQEKERNYKPYFSRTFLKDGKFIRASLHKNDMITVANEYYWKTSPPTEKWIILEINPHYLYYNMGIPILANVTAPENSRNNTNTTKPEIKCLQIFGGLSTNPITLSKLITNIYPIHRQSTISTSTSTENVGKFISIGSGSTSTSAAAAVVQVVPEQPKQQQSTTTTPTTMGETKTNNNGKMEKKKKKKNFGGLLRKMVGVGRFQIIKGRD
ncbi:hypothetical protein FRACYDRAFT_258579 [Fragilariopsis cylindrus CCMP1102]|uniref:Uncharacterized protein n=1 Tax=Fragilariopsis cylindrus CCMP1102 TaxID=635003 RepID=A0A1E7EIJ6_9STRA|nr:hypothetical protein FRACYDRAFT_258579 [Fragilariopsis cylindrus CCMP1102]|eukprot:OEU05711.1 hypothetical protein FRACYDRAFT_258579 [Fragilariopsis cylindrus CCMP1102]